MLQLKAPFGYPEGVGIQMHAPHDQACQVADIARSFGCPGRVCRNVQHCIAASGRYDCRVSLSRISIIALNHAMNQLGGEIVVSDVRELDPKYAAMVQANYRLERLAKLDRKGGTIHRMIYGPASGGPTQQITRALDRSRA